MTYFIAPAFNFPTQIVEEYEANLLKKLKHDYYITKEAFDKIDKSSFVDQYNQDSIVDEINSVVDRLKEAIENREEFIKTYQIAETLISFIRQQIRSILRNKSLIDYNFDLSANSFEKEFTRQSMLIRSWVDSNVNITKALSANQLSELTQILSKGYRAGFSYDIIVQQMQYQLEINKKKAAFIARKEITELNSDYIRSESLKYGFDLYIWRTSNDDRVRPSHQVLNRRIMTWLNAKIFKYKVEDKKWLLKSILPASYQENGETIKGGVQKQCGHDYGCRCMPSMIIDLSKYNKKASNEYYLL